jgi:hypothetical protein
MFKVFLHLRLQHSELIRGAQKMRSQIAHNLNVIRFGWSLPDVVLTLQDHT